MLDENLPTFYLKPSADEVKHHRSFYLTERGSQPDPVYSLHQLDPSLPKARNCYAAALFDAYHPESLFGEVLVRPGWTQPSVSQEDIRRNGGVPPPPQPIVPNQFTIQLYNPDQQVAVKQKAGTWGGSASYEFSMPQNSFRLPSAAGIDKTMSDPSADATTPMVNFVWRRDGKLSKDLTCFMTGKSTDPTVKRRKERDPDIAVAIFRGMREITIYEPNLYRIDMEDPKGLEVTLLLCAATIKDLYFSQTKETFNISDPSATRQRSGSSPTTTSAATLTRKNSPPNSKQAVPPTVLHSAPPPTADPRTEWETNLETARLRAESDAEAREAAARRREQEKSDALEAKRLRKQLDQEEKEQRRKQAEVDKETERLRRKYGVKEQNQAAAQLLQPSSAAAPPPQPPRPDHQRGHSAPLVQGPFPPADPSSKSKKKSKDKPHTRHHDAPSPQPIPPQPQRPHWFGAPVHPPPGPLTPPPPKPPRSPVAMTGANGGGYGYYAGVSANGLLRPEEGKKLKAPKKSFWGLRTAGEEQKVAKKKKSSMF